MNAAEVHADYLFIREIMHCDTYYMTQYTDVPNSNRWLDPDI